MIDAGQHYWEVRFDRESKTFAAGIAYRSLGRFDQLGKSNASWCIHLNNWLQQSLTAKYNNKARTLDCPIPDRIGIYCNYEEGEFIKKNGGKMGVVFAREVFKVLLSFLYTQAHCLSTTLETKLSFIPSEPSSSSLLYQRLW